MAERWIVERPEKPHVVITVFDEEQLELANSIKKAYETKRYVDLARINLKLPKELMDPIFTKTADHILTVDVIKKF